MSEIRGLPMFILLTALAWVTKAQDTCIVSRPCYCQNSNSTFIDLRPFGSKRFQAKSFQHSFELQLCETFDLQGSCMGVYGCLKRTISPKYFSLGDNVHFTDSTHITYTGRDSITIVQLQCTNEEEATLDFLKESPKKTFIFLLKSKHACIQAFPANSEFLESDSSKETTQRDSTAETSETATEASWPTETTVASTTEAIGTTESTGVSTTEASGTTDTTGESTTEASGTTESTGVSTTEASGPTETTGESTTGTSEATDTTGVSTTEASGPTESTGVSTTEESGTTDTTGELSTTSQSESTSAASLTTAASAATDTTPTTTHSDAGGLSTLTLGTIFLVALLSRSLT